MAKLTAFKEIIRIYLNPFSRITSAMLILAFAFAFAFISVAEASNGPNVIFILTDDQGYGDLSCHGNPIIKTPNLDNLHAESVRFTNFHVDPTCAPTRAALMTGKYSHHAGVWHTICGGNHLRTSELTMAEVFKASGYRTGLFGKWHLGSNYPYRPMDRGFDEWLGQGDGGTGTTDDWFFNDRVNDYYWHNGERVYLEGYAPDVFFNEAIDFIKSDKQNEKPFFVYLATYLPHSPHTLPDTSMIEKYSGSIPESVAYFFAGIDRIDQNIGKIREALEESGKAENTIIVFMTDNGGTEGVNLFNAGMRGRKGEAYEGGHRVPLFIHWPGGNLNHGTDVKDLTAHIDVMPTLIDLCGLSAGKEVDFDGRSFKNQLFKPQENLPGRILFVENQRTPVSIAWWKTAGMMNHWRLIDNKELYDLSKDTAQTTNVIEQYPEVVQKIQKAHTAYWAHVTPGDRETPIFIVGHPGDEETFLTSSDWHLPDTPWNHAQLARGSPLAGAWEITVAKEGRYRFELYRWPREANATIQGVPTFQKKLDAWKPDGGVGTLIYGDEINPLPVHAITLEVGGYKETRIVDSEDKHLTFDVKLKKGNTTVKGVMLNKQKQVISGACYIYLTKL